LTKEEDSNERKLLLWAEAVMQLQWHHLLSVVTLVTASAEALGQQVAPTIGLGNIGSNRAAPIPDFSGVWRHTSLPWFTPPASGPGPVMNRSRRNGVSNYDQLVGDYTNPILLPWAADVVKKYGEISLRGVTYPNPANQCWPEPVPFIFKNNGMQVVQEPHQVTFLYDENHQFRQVRLSQPHPAAVTPSWYGDSVGHYDGDTLVVDTVGVKPDRPFAMIDLFGTPYTQALHVIERYRLIGYEVAKEVEARDAKENYRPPGDIDRNYRGHWLQVDLAIEDEGAFTTPWTASVIYGRGSGIWQEKVCAENTLGYYYQREGADVPRADKPDF
jgi:hypothetical protein